MRWTVILLIALVLIISGCSEEKTQPETNITEAQKTAEPVSTEQAVSETTAPQVATSEEGTTSEEQTAPEPASEPPKKADDANYVVYYMTSSVRCASCYKIENWTKEAVNKYFANDVKSGKMKFEMINIEEPEHEHYIEHYELFTKSVIVSKKVDGKEVSWKNLARVWNLLNDQNEFMTYIRDEIMGFKSGAGS